MSYIEELLKNAKVEWKKLGEVCVVSKGEQFNKRDMLETGTYPVINGGITPSGFVEVFNNQENTITVSQGGASSGFVNFIKTKFWLGAHAFSVLPSSEIIKYYNYDSICFNRYLFHILKQNQDKLQKSKCGAGIPSLSKETLLSVDIPIVSNELQAEIVRILDTFAELTLREKQYRYYLKKLLSKEYLKECNRKIEEGKVVEVKLMDVVNIKHGRDYKHLKSGNIPVYGSGGNLNIYVDEYSYNKPTVLIPRKGSIKNIFYLESPFWNTDTIFYTEIDITKLLPKYFYFFMKNYNLEPISTNPTRPSITKSILNKIPIPLPSLSIQEEIIKVLDKFESLIKESSGLLPKEIEARQKQYEYYREKLLSFNQEKS